MQPATLRTSLYNLDLDQCAGFLGRKIIHGRAQLGMFGLHNFVNLFHCRLGNRGCKAQPFGGKTIDNALYFRRVSHRYKLAVRPFEGDAAKFDDSVQFILVCTGNILSKVLLIIVLIMIGFPIQSRLTDFGQLHPKIAFIIFATCFRELADAAFGLLIPKLHAYNRVARLSNGADYGDKRLAQ